MIDNEERLFQLVASKLRQKYEKIYITGRAHVNMEVVFPCVWFYSTSQNIDQEMIAFDKIENAVNETFEVQIFSDLEVGREKQCKEILNYINQVLEAEGCVRFYNQPVPNYDISIARRVARYSRKSTN